MTADVKFCNTCGVAKPLSEFYRSPGMRDGHRNDCKACNLAAKKRRYEADPKAHIQRVKRWQQENSDRLNAIGANTTPGLNGSERCGTATTAGPTGSLPTRSMR